MRVRPRRADQLDEFIGGRLATGDNCEFGALLVGADIREVACEPVGEGGGGDAVAEAVDVAARELNVAAKRIGARGERAGDEPDGRIS